KTIFNQQQKMENQLLMAVAVPLRTIPADIFQSNECSVGLQEYIKYSGYLVIINFHISFLNMRGEQVNRTSLIKLIHVARRELPLDDDTYRAFLMQNTGKISCRELTVAQLELVLDAMKERGFKKQNKHPRRRFNGHVTPREKVLKIWQQMAEDGFIADGSDTAL